MKRSTRLASMLAVLIALGCGDDGPTDVETETYAIEVAESPGTEAVVGAAVAAGVRVTDSDGDPATGVAVRWSVIEGGGSVGSGTTTTNGSGEASIEWTLGTAAGEQRIEASVGERVPVAFTVEATPDSPAMVEVSPAAHSFEAAGESTQLDAGVLDRHGNEVAGSDVSWSVDDPAVAAVDADGRVEALKQGMAMVTASSDTVEGRATVMVDPAAASVTISSDADTVDALDATRLLAATVTDGNGNAVEGAAVEWTSLDEVVASVSPRGQIRALATGTVDVTAQAGDAADTAEIVVRQEADAVRVTPTLAELAAIEDTVHYTAAAEDRNGHAIPDANVTWSSADAAVATVEGDGVVEAVANGTVEITASVDGTSGSGAARVEQAPAGIDVSPVALGTFDGQDTVSVGEDLSQALEATVQDANGNPITGADVAWSVSDAGTATVEQDGTVTGVREGAATVTAASGEASASIDVVVPGKIAFASLRDGNREIYLVNADGTGLTRLTHNDEPDFSPIWSPDGSRMAFRSDRDGNGEIYALNADGSDPTRLTNDPEFETDPAWSPDGSKVVFYSRRDGNDEIYTVSATGVGPTRITNDASSDRYGAWSPDGDRIAFTSRRDSDNEIYAIDPDGANLTRLTNDSGSDIIPNWSPDGSKLTFRSDRDGDDDIFVMDPDGNNKVNLTNNPGGIDRDAAWSPDGSQILFWSNRDGDWEVYVMDADGTNQTNLTNSPASDEVRPVWSPDGSRIAFYSDRDGNNEIYIMNADGTEQTRLTENGASDESPEWRPSP